MTASISNESKAMTAAAPAAAAEPHIRAALPAAVDAPRTLASRFIILTLCVAIVLSALAFGTVHSWSLAVFQMGAGLIIVLWSLDAWHSRRLRVSRSVLQWPLLGLIALGLIQLLPLGTGVDNGAGAISVEPVRSLSLNPYATRQMVIHVASLLIYFAAALAFIDSPRRLRLVARAIMIFGFLLAIFSLTQYFVSPTKIYGFREPRFAAPFGPFVNRHHFAGYMELALALPLGLLSAGAVSIDRRLLYGFAAAIMGIALIMTNSRGGMLSLAAEILFLLVLSGVSRKRAGSAAEEPGGGRSRLVSAAMRAALGLVIIAALFMSALIFGGEQALSRLVGTVNADDPTTGRVHFWRTTLDIIRDHPLTGAGLGAFSLAYTRYDTSSGRIYRLEQAHNDYLQVLSDAGVVGAGLGLLFIIALFRTGFARAESEDKFRRGVAIGALAGCFAVLVHSAFDFTLHTTANALLFLTLAALATINGRVEERRGGGRRRRHRRHRGLSGVQPPGATAAT